VAIVAPHKAIMVFMAVKGTKDGSTIAEQKEGQNIHRTILPNKEN